MTEFENNMENMETTEVYPESTEEEATYSYDYPETEEQTDNASAAFIAGVFAAGTAVGIGVTKLAGKVKQKIAEKRGEQSEKPVKRKTKLKFQLPWRREEVLEVPVKPAESKPENPEPNQNQEG